MLLKILPTIFQEHTEFQKLLLHEWCLDINANMTMFLTMTYSHNELI